MIRQLALLLLGVFACSTAVILIKGTTVDALWLSSIRLLLAALVIAPLWLRDRAKIKPRREDRYLSLAPALFLGLHMLTWLYGARITPAAQSTLIVNLAPLASPFFLFLMVGERVKRREVLGTLMAVVGVAILFADDLIDPDGAWLGNAICFGSMLLFCVYLVLARQLRERSTLWTYLGPLYLQAGIICAIGAACFGPPPNPLSWSLYETLMVLGLAIIPTVIGHSLLNHAMRSLRGQLVTTSNTAQCIFAAIMAYFLFGEKPDLAFYLAAVAILAGILMTILGPDKKVTPTGAA